MTAPVDKPASDAGRRAPSTELLMTKLGGRAPGVVKGLRRGRAFGSVAYAHFSRVTVWSVREPRSRHIFRAGSLGFVDDEGRKADAIGIGPVHREWTGVDGDRAPPAAC